MLHHQTWLAEEALRNRGLLQAAPKDFPHRFNPLGDFLAKEYHASHLHPSTADFLQCATSSASSSSAAETPITSKQQRSHAAQQQQQQQQQYKQQTQPYNIRYPSPAGGFFHPQHHHHHHQQQQLHSPHLLKASKRQSTPSPHQTATSTQSSVLLDELRRKTESGPPPDDDSVIDISSGREESHTPRELGSIMPVATSSLLYKDSPLDQLLHRRRSSSSLGGAGAVDSTLRSYSQLLLSTTPSCTDTSSCKEKSSSSSTSSTPPPTSALLAQHQQLSQMLKSPSDSSLFGGDGIEEETRCVVCNAHFPNVWLLEQHAALQHPLLGPGEEKPFICEQCGQSYRYRSAYAKHKEQNHRARLPADKLFTCDVCGMQFRYLKSFKKHRLNHALERLHGKKGVGGKHLPPATAAHLEQDVVTSSQEAAMPADEGEDLRVKVKRERPAHGDDDGGDQLEDDQDSTIDSASVLLFNDTNSSASAATSGVEQNISSTDAIHSTNKRPRLLTTPVIESDPSYRHQHHRLHHGHMASQYPHVGGHMHAASTSAGHSQSPQQATVSGSQLSASPPAPSMASLTSLNSITSLINAERIPNEQQFLGLNPQEASILNFLRVDAAERQRDKRPQTSRFACPFCGKCVRSKENLKLHVRKHTGERPFVCLFCGRAFGGKSDLTRHLRIHTGERPYHCESCGKCFARADYLSKHLTTHIHNAPR